MPDASRNTRPNDLPEVATRNRTARHTIAGFSATDIWRYLDTALADNPALSAEITRLRAELAGARLNLANLAAAALSTLAAHYEREPDPLSYLRDELRAQGHCTNRGRA